MTNMLLRTLLGATCLSLAVVGTASAGGFARGNADTDLIYEDGNFNMRAGVTFVSPSRKFTQHGNPALVGTTYTDDYIVPSFSVKMNLTDNFRCTATHVMNMGGAAEYDAPTLSGKLEEKFDTYESALTCGVKFQVGSGNLWVLGGGFMEQFDYNRVNFTSAVTPNALLNLRGEDYGYRVGVAYEIPEIAFRTQLMYRSGTKYGADGTLVVPGALLGLPVATATLPAIGEGELPQTIELKVQSGIAPGWLAFGSVKWSDWSVTEQLIATAFHPVTGAIVRRETNDYFWKDGWTITGGIGHAFNEQVSGLVALTYDQGVATGWDLTSDTWTLAFGASVKDKLGGELRAGLGITYLTSAEETKYAVGTNAAADSGWAFAGNIGYAIKW